MKIEITEIKNTVFEMRTSLCGVNYRLVFFRKKISELEDIATEIILNKQRRGKRLKKKKTVSVYWEYFKLPDIHVFGIVEKEDAQWTKK